MGIFYSNIQRTAFLLPCCLFIRLYKLSLKRINERTMTKRFKIIRFVLYSIPLLTISQTLYSQSEVAYTRGKTIMEDILPPSPEAASSVKYAGVPMNHSLGAAEYSVPLYILEGRQLSLPISLDYRSNGIKVDEIAGVAGLGWALNAGGCITREVVYMPDEFDNWSFYSMPDANLLDNLVDQVWNNQTQSILTDIMWNRTDISSDRYSYSVAGLSGTFIVTPNKQVVQLSGDGVIITPHISSEDNKISEFLIVGPDGTRYSFAEKEESSRKNQQVIMPTFETGQEIEWDATTAWYLTRITSADLTETANFSYSSGGLWKRNIQDYSYCKTVTTYSGGIMDPDNPPHYSNNGGYVETECNTRVLSSISLRGFTVSFTYLPQSTTENHKAGNRARLNNFPCRLTGVDISSQNNNLVSYTIDTQRHNKDGRVLLNGVRQYHVSSLTDQWSFTYKTLDYEIYRYSQDWYGYYNNENNDEGIIVFPFPGAGQNPDGSYTDINEGYPLEPDSGSGHAVHDYRPRGNLSPYKLDKTVSPASIVLSFGYPVSSDADYMSLLEANHNGARTVFEYEGALSGLTSAGHAITVGVRVRRISVFDGNNLKQCRSFDYSAPAVDGVWHPMLSDYVTLVATASSELLGSMPVSSITWDYTVHEFPVSVGASIESCRIIYGTVSEKVHPSPTDTVGVRTVYHYDTGQSCRSGYSVGDRFPQYTYNVFTSQLSSSGNPENTIKTGYVLNESTAYPTLIRKESYRLNAQSQEELYESEEYEYRSFGNSYQLIDYFAKEVLADGINIGNVSPNRTHHFPVYTRKKFGIVPKKKTIVGYHQSGNDSTVVEYTHCSRSLLNKPIRVSTVRIAGTDGDRIMTCEYPDSINMNAGWTEGLVSRHSLIEPIRTNYYLLSGTDTTRVFVSEKEYDHFVSGAVSHLQPKSRRELLNGNVCWEETVLSRDEMGNITSVKERGKPIKHITWSYGGMYPVSITEGSGTIQLSTTYEWMPGIGMTRMTTPQGISTYYEYDNSGRLYRIRNTLGQIREEFSYNLLNTGSNNVWINKKTFVGPSNYIEDKTWYNTLGMKLLSVSGGAAGNGAALVSTYEGDYLLHDDVKIWQPFPALSWDGGFVSNAANLSLTYHSSIRAYTYTEYEKSLRDRIVSTSLPGYWNHKNINTVDVRSSYPYYIWTDNGIEQVGVYPVSEVLSETYTDADNRKTTILKNRFGVLLGEEYGNGNMSCRYIYDRSGRLRAVAGGGISNADTLSMWRYDYDSLGRVKSKGMPGTIREYYQYDNEDRIISIRKNTDLVEQVYDSLGRLSEKYLIKGEGLRVLIEQHLYDNYSSEAASVFQEVSPAIPGSVQTCNSMGLETYTKLAIIGENDSVQGYSKAAHVYDYSGRLIRSSKKHTDSIGGYFSEEYRYDYRDNPIQTSYKSGSPNSGWEILDINTDYDLRERPIRQVSTLTVGGIVSACDTTTFIYDDMGRIWEKTSSSGGESIQAENTYTLQGFLSSRTSAISGHQIFGEYFRYESPRYSGFNASYTGHITDKKTIWTDSNSTETINNQAYEYDAAGCLSRLGESSGESSINSGYDFSYDLRGNITHRYRYHGFNEQTLYDTYNYSGDRITSIKIPWEPHPISNGQLGANTNAFNPNPTMPSKTYYFTHDPYGRMTSDGLSGAQISYNHLNLPAKITKGTNICVSSSYSVNGGKRSTVKQSGDGLVYFGPMTYKLSVTGDLTFDSVIMDDKRIMEDGVQYHLTDRLGSVRAVVRGSDGALIKCYDYDVFGNISDGPLPVVSSPYAQRYHFEGQEDLSTDFSIPYLDYGARVYPPKLRRWIVPDPESERYYGLSPYSFCAGDPINYIDEDGRAFKRKWYSDRIVVSAMIFADKRSVKSAKQAANFWNKRKDSYYVGSKKYLVEYNIVVSPVSSYNNLSGDNSNRYSVESANSLVSRAHPGAYDAGQTTGVTKNLIYVDERYAELLPNSKVKSSTGAHEIGHFLGIHGHEENTIMSEYQDEKRALSVNQEQVNEIIESEFGTDDLLHKIKVWLGIN